MSQAAVRIFSEIGGCGPGAIQASSLRDHPPFNAVEKVAPYRGPLGASSQKSEDATQGRDPGESSVQPVSVIVIEVAEKFAPCHVPLGASS